MVVLTARTVKDTASITLEGTTSLKIDSNWARSKGSFSSINIFIDPRDTCDLGDNFLGTKFAGTLDSGILIILSPHLTTN